MKKPAGTIEEALKKAFRPVTVLIIAGLGGILLMAAGVEMTLLLQAVSQGGTAMKGAFTAAAASVVFALIYINNSKSRLDPSQPAKYINRLFYYDVITVIVCEIPAVLGLALFLLTGSRADFYLHAMLSVIFFLFFRPKFVFWQRLAPRQKA